MSLLSRIHGKLGWIYDFYICYAVKRLLHILTFHKPIQQFDLYAQMVKDLENQDPVYKSSKLWSAVNSDFRKLFYTKGLKHFKEDHYNRMFSNPSTDNIYRSLLWVYSNALRSRDKHRLLDWISEPAIGGGNAVKIGNQRLTFDLLQSVDEFYSIMEGVDAKKRLVVGELGAGYGRLAYVFLKALPKTTYVIVDLPESLIIAQSYLTEVFRGEKVLTYEQSRKMSSFTRENLSGYKLVFLLPHQLSKMEEGAFDIFSNIFSFQEMQLAQVKNYMKAVNRICNGVCYLKQLYHTKNHFDNIVVTEKSYPVPKHWKKIFSRPSGTYHFAFESLYKTS